MPSTRPKVILWPYRKVPFLIDQDHPQDSAIRAAMREIESSTPIFFSQRTSDRDYLRFTYRDIKSESGIGKSPDGGAQLVNIRNQHTPLHELGHALGLIHEHCRSDRDQYVWINEQFIDPLRMADFTLESDSDNLTVYDTGSIMHYPSPAEGWGGPPGAYVPTMTYRPDPGATLGPSNWGRLSDMDKFALTKLYARVPGWSWPLGLAMRAAFGPRAAANGDVLVMACQGSGGNGIYWAARSPTTGWSQSVRLDGVGTSAAPAVACDQGQVFLTWRGVGSDGGIYGTVFANGLWAPQYRVPNVGTSEAPAMAFWNGQLVLLFKGVGDNGLWWSAWDRRFGWIYLGRIPNVGTSSGPALAVFEGKLFGAWRGVGTDASLYFAINDGSGWSAQGTVPGAGSTQGPSLAVYGGKLWMVWKGVGDQGIWWSTYETATGWCGQARIPVAATVDTPTLATVGNKLVLLWKGSDGTVGTAQLPDR